jgi:hypothetical protein
VPAAVLDDLGLGGARTRPQHDHGLDRLAPRLVRHADDGHLVHGRVGADDLLQKNIAHDWQLALPLVADLLRRKSFDQARPLIDEAVRALLRLKTGEAWDPREGLLISHPSLRYASDRDAGVFRLLESWRKVATGLGQDELACALELQVVVGRRWVDGASVLEAFRRVPSPRFASIRDRLFANWRSLVDFLVIGPRQASTQRPNLTVSSTHSNV